MKIVAALMALMLSSVAAYGTEDFGIQYGMNDDDDGDFGLTMDDDDGDSGLTGDSRDEIESPLQNEVIGNLRGRRVIEEALTGEIFSDETIPIEDGGELSLAASSCPTNCSGFSTKPRHGCCEGYYCNYGLLVVAGACQKN